MNRFHEWGCVKIKNSMRMTRIEWICADLFNCKSVSSPLKSALSALSACFSEIWQILSWIYSLAYFIPPSSILIEIKSLKAFNNSSV